MTKSSKNRPSILNWMGTLILYAIPGISLIFLIITAIFAKSTSKRNFAIAGIILQVLVLVITFACFAVFPDYFRRLADAMREAGTMMPVG